MIPIQNLSPEWQKTIRELLQLANTLDHAEVVIKIQDKKPVLTEYTIKRKTSEVTPFEIKGLDEY